MNIGLLASARSAHTAKIANGLAARGHNVMVYSSPDHEQIDDALGTDVVVRYFKIGGAASYFVNHNQLRRWLAADRVDVLNAHYASGYGTTSRLSRFHPTALSVWGSDVYDFPHRGRLKRSLLQQNLRAADVLMSTSNAMARVTSALAPNRPIVVTPFGVDTQLFSPRPQEETGSSVRIGFVKTIDRNYGLENLLDALAQLDSRDNPSIVHLEVFGDGPMRELMIQRAKQLGVDHIVTFHGRLAHRDVPAAWHSVDIFCVPSVSESFGVAAVEAMACGLAGVTSDAAGLAEVMEDGVTGYVVPTGDPLALAEALAHLIDDPELRARMGRNSRRRVLEHYDWQDNLGLIERTLLGLLLQEPLWPDDGTAR